MKKKEKAALRLPVFLRGGHPVDTAGSHQRGGLDRKKHRESAPEASLPDVHRADGPRFCRGLFLLLPAADDPGAGRDERFLRSRREFSTPACLSRELSW